VHYNPCMRTPPLALMLLLSACAPPESPGPPLPSPESLNKKLSQLLRETDSKLPLHKRTLADINAAYLVDIVDRLPWPEALKYADTHYATDPRRRAVFLFTHITPGLPASAIDDFHLQRSSLPYDRTGAGVSTKLLLSADGSDTIELWSTDPIVTDSGPLHLNITAIGPLRLTHVDRPDLTLDFDQSLTLYRWWLNVPDAGVTLTVAAASTGQHSANYYYGYAQDAFGNTVHHAEFNPDFTVRVPAP